jgi:hypothetical protein
VVEELETAATETVENAAEAVTAEFTEAVQEESDL